MLKSEKTLLERTEWPERPALVKPKSHENIADDERYTRAFVNDKMTYNQWGRRKIEQALYQKGVSKDVSNRVLDEVPDEDYIAILRPLIHRKWKTVTGRNDYERSMKLIRYAMGRGFDIEQIKQCIDQADDWMND